MLLYVLIRDLTATIALDGVVSVLPLLLFSLVLLLLLNQMLLLQLWHDKHLW